MSVESDKALHVEFSRRSVEVPAKSREAGRPIFEDVDFVRICVPGSQLTIIERPVDEFDQQRFPIHWQAYQNSQCDAREVGTPIRQWPMLSPAIREELHAMKFRTVEQLAAATDQQLSDIGMVAGMAGQALRGKAQAYLEAAAGAASVEKYQSEVEALRAELAEMKASKRGPGRPRKEAVSDTA